MSELLDTCGSLRCVKRPSVVQIAPHLPSLNFIVNRVAEISKKREKLAEQCAEHWSIEHAMTLPEKLPKLSATHPGFRPTQRFLYGCGRCICSGRGSLVRLATTRLVAHLVK